MKFYKRDDLAYRFIIYGMPKEKAQNSAALCVSASRFLCVSADTIHRILHEIWLRDSVTPNLLRRLHDYGIPLLSICDCTTFDYVCEILSEFVAECEAEERNTFYYKAGELVSKFKALFWNKVE